MIPIKSFWCGSDRGPTKEEIQEAFNVASQEEVIVSIEWHIKYNGTHRRLIDKEITEQYTPEKYWKEVIPHIYGV